MKFYDRIKACTDKNKMQEEILECSNEIAEKKEEIIAFYRKIKEDYKEIIDLDNKITEKMIKSLR